MITKSAHLLLAGALFAFPLISSATTDKEAATQGTHHKAHHGSHHKGKHHGAHHKKHHGSHHKAKHHGSHHKAHKDSTEN